MAHKPILSIIIVNWNGLEHLKISLPALRNQRYSPTKVYLVDNASSDGSVEFIKEHYPEVILIVNEKNLGFAEGNNRGIARALEDGCDYVFLLNNDTNMKSNTLNSLIDYMEKHPRIGIAQPKLLLLDNPDTLDSCGSHLSRTGFLLHVGVEEKDAPRYNKVIPLFTIKGAAMIMRRTMLDEIGFLDPDFFAYFEETDLCWRAWLYGWKVYYAPVATVYHKMGGSTKKIGSPTINYHSYKNRIMSYIKNLSWYNLIWMLPLHIILIIGFSFIYFVALRGKSGFSIYRAMYWNIANLSKNLKKRKQIQSERVVTDKVLFPIIMRPIPWTETLAFASRIFLGVRKTEQLARKGKA